LDDSDEHTSANPKNSLKRKLEFDRDESPKRQRVENTDHVDVKSNNTNECHSTELAQNVCEEEALFGLGDFDLGEQLTITPVNNKSPTPVTPTSIPSLRSAPTTPFRLFSSPSLSAQTKKRISLSLQKIT